MADMAVVAMVAQVDGEREREGEREIERGREGEGERERTSMGHHGPRTLRPVVLAEYVGAWG